MATEFYCEICNAPMVLVKKLSTVKRVNTMYRRRKFKCTVCDFEEMICGDGTRDKKQTGIPDEVTKFYKQEEENRELTPL
jgi:transposase-like protein